MNIKFSTIIFFLLLVVTILPPKSAFAAIYTLSGYVQNSSGTALIGATVEIKNPSTNAIVESTTTDSSGDYSLNVNEGTYNVQITPASGSGFSPAVAVNQVISGNKTLNFVLAPTGSFTMSGHVYNALGSPLENQTITLRDPDTNAVVASTTSNSVGYYSLEILPNTYRIQINGKNALNVSAPRFYNLLLSEYSFTQSTYIDFKLPFKKVDVHVEDDLQADFSDVKLQTSTASTNASFSVSGINASLVVSYYDSSTSGVGTLPYTNSSGNATLWLFPTGSNDPYTFIAEPSRGSNFATTNLTNVFITGDTTKTITMQKFKNLTGHLYDSEGGTLPNQSISLREPGTNNLIATATTDSNGFYSLLAIPNSYNIQLSASNNSNILKAPKTYNLIVGQYTLANDSVLDLTLPFKKVDLHVQDAFNTPISDVEINTEPTSSVNGIFSVSGLNASLVISYYAAGGANPLPQTDVDGNVTLWLLPNGSDEPYSFVATPQSGSGYTPTTLTNNFITNTTNKTLTLQKPVTLTGQVVNPLGDPLVNQTVALLQPGTFQVVATTTTDTQGNYSLATTAHTYTVQVTGKNNISTNAPRFYNLLLSDYSLTETTDLDLTLPFKKIDIHMQNQANASVSDVEFRTSTAATNATLSVSGLNASLVVSYYDPNTTGVGSMPKTDQDGNTTLWLFPSGSNDPYTLFATPQAGSPYLLLLQNINVANNENKIVSLQYNHDAPVTTATLETQHADDTYSNPTTVTLSTSAASGYTIENTYYIIDGGTQQTYTTPFTVPGDGEHTIEHWSVDNSGVQETPKTKTFTILARYNLVGTVYIDVNHNGVQDTGELGYDGATIGLNTGQTTATDSNGEYTFSNLPTDVYIETLTVPSGFTATTTNPVTVPLTADTTQNFGIAPIPTPTDTPTPTPTETPTPTPTSTPTPAQNKITALSPAKVWVGLPNFFSAGAKFDLLAEAYKDTTLISSGQLNSINPGLGFGGFTSAKLQTIPFGAFTPVNFPQGSQLSIKVSARTACVGSLSPIGTARLWYNDSQANSNYGATIGTNTSTYYLRPNAVLTTTVGSGPKQTSDVLGGAACSAFKSFGTWTITP